MSYSITSLRLHSEQALWLSLRPFAFAQGRAQGKPLIVAWDSSPQRSLRGPHLLRSYLRYSGLPMHSVVGPAAVPDTRIISCYRRGVPLLDGRAVA